MSTRITSGEICVVVQGLIFGKMFNDLTLKCLQSIRKYLPNAKIILSTWKGLNVENLDFDVLIQSKDPKSYTFKGIQNNINRQLVSTKGGLEHANRKYTLKIRTDMIIEGVRFLDYFGKHRARHADWKILKKRVLNCAYFARNAREMQSHLFHPSDWLFFGLTDDVKMIFDIPLESETERHKFAPEQYLWLKFLSKHKSIEIEDYKHFSNELLELSELTIANNLTLLEPKQLQIKLPKYNKIPLIDYLTCYSHADWLELYHKNCTGKKIARLDFKKILAFIYFGFAGFFIQLKAFLKHPRKFLSRS